MTESAGLAGIGAELAMIAIALLIIVFLLCAILNELRRKP